MRLTLIKFIFMPGNKINKKIQEAGRLIKNAGCFSAFTGAGISVESGIPPFRGENGLWSIYDPDTFEIGYFLQYPEKSWELLRKLFYETFERAEPNQAHLVLAELEQKGLLKALITQNIDNLHYRAGSKNIIEYHGSSRELICTTCGNYYPVSPQLLQKLPPLCGCGGILKPDFVFFGEGIPPRAAVDADRVSEETDVMIVIGTTGEVYPAAIIPQNAKQNGAAIIEVNTHLSQFTNTITDIFLEGKASEIMTEIRDMINTHLK